MPHDLNDPRAAYLRRAAAMLTILAHAEGAEAALERLHVPDAVGRPRPACRPDVANVASSLRGFADTLNEGGIDPDTSGVLYVVADLLDVAERHRSGHGDSVGADRYFLIRDQARHVLEAFGFDAGHLRRVEDARARPLQIATRHGVLAVDDAGEGVSVGMIPPGPAAFTIDSDAPDVQGFLERERLEDEGYPLDELLDDLDDEGGVDPLDVAFRTRVALLAEGVSRGEASAASIRLAAALFAGAAHVVHAFADDKGDPCRLRLRLDGEGGFTLDVERQVGRAGNRAAVLIVDDPPSPTDRPIVLEQIGDDLEVVRPYVPGDSVPRVNLPGDADDQG